MNKWDVLCYAPAWVLAIWAVVAATISFDDTLGALALITIALSVVAHVAGYKHRLQEYHRRDEYGA